MANRVGQQLGNYHLLRMLGQGAFAAVYLGKHQYLERPAAIKVLHVQIEPVRHESFRREAHTIAQLDHPHIIGVHDFGIEDQTPYLVMEYMQGGTLRERFPKGSQLSFEQIVTYVKQIASALDYAHQQRVIHRDIKPENILLNSKHEVVLSDFGIAVVQHTLDSLSTQSPAGTPRYMAPEQIQHKPCAASDQYALGVMVYEWLCGEPPFHGSLYEIWSQHLHKSPPSLRARLPELPPAVEDAVFGILAKDPQHRFTTVQDFATALEEAFFATQPLLLSRSVKQEEIKCPLARVRLAPVPSPRGQDHIDDATQPRIKTIQRIEEECERGVSISHQAKHSLAQTNRQRLLRRVRSFWITGVLEQSLHGEALMSLGLQVQPDAVANPWRLIMQESEHTSPPLPEGTRITEVYDSSGGELLILGEPGSGKTTLLLELARDLLRRAEQELTHPIPVVFNLSSWTRKTQPLAVWLIEEMETKYRVPRRVGSDWINANQILPLLDGLDEVDTSYRTSCMQAIDEYHQTHSLVPLVVCCRVNEYMSQANRLALYRAVTIQPLTTSQINEYFAHAGEQIASLRIAFQHDPVLQELATTPLMLTILILTHQGASLEEIKGDVSAEVRQQEIFATYTQRMLRRRSARSQYSPQQTIHWLSHLAQQMKQQSQTVFHIERMQPSWLTKKWQRRFYYSLMVGPICCLLVGLTILDNLMPFLLTVLMTTLIIGLLIGWFSEPKAEKKGTRTIMRTWMYIQQSLSTALENRLIIGVVTGLAVGISTALYSYQVDYPNDLFGIRIAFALNYGLLAGIWLGFPLGLAIRLERRIEPTEALGWSWTGIRRNILRWLLIGIGIGLVVGLIEVLIFVFSLTMIPGSVMTRGQGLWLPVFLIYGLWVGFDLLFVMALVNGVKRGLLKGSLDARHIVTPNQGTWRSARYGVVIAIIIGVMFAVFAGAGDFMRGFLLPLDMGGFAKPSVSDYSIVRMMGHLLGFHPTTRQEFWTLDALFIGPICGAVPGLAAGLYCGGAAYIQHFVLRFLLWRSRCVPFNYTRFLDYAAERILLRKVGGGYIFIHRLLLEYFASLEEKPDPRKSET